MSFSVSDSSPGRSHSRATAEAEDPRVNGVKGASFNLARSNDGHGDGVDEVGAGERATGQVLRPTGAAIGAGESVRGHLMSAFKGPILPLELFRLILSDLSKSDLANCLGTSTAMHDLMAPYLYERVAVDVRATPPPLQPAEALALQYGRSVRQRRYELQHPELLPLPYRFTLGSHFTFTTHLAIPSHSELYCSSLQYSEHRWEPLVMPNLVTLRVPSLQLALCLSENGGRDESARAECCPLVSQLRPRRLIIGDKRMSLVGTGRGLWSSPSAPSPFPPSFIKELIVIVGARDKRRFVDADTADHNADVRVDEHGVGQRSGGDFHIDRLPSSLERLTLVYEHEEIPKPVPRPADNDDELEDVLMFGAALARADTSFPGVADYIAGQREFPEGRTPLCEFEVPYLIARAVCGRFQGEVEVVGMETLPPKPNPPRSAEVLGEAWEAGAGGTDRVRRGLERYLTKRGYEAEEAERRSDGVIFTTGQEFVRRAEDCRGGFLRLDFGKTRRRGEFGR